MLAIDLLLTTLNNNNLETREYVVLCCMLYKIRCNQMHNLTDACVVCASVGYM